MAFLGSTKFNLGHGPGWEQRQAGFLEVILGSYFLVIGSVPGTVLGAMGTDAELTL